MPKKPKLKKRADGRYSRQVYLGLGEDGKRQYKTVYGSSQKEVEERALDIKFQLKKGMDLSYGRDRFRDWSAAWLADKKDNVSASYYGGLKGKVVALDEEFGDTSMRKIMPVHIQSLINRYAECNPHTHRPTAKKWY